MDQGGLHSERVLDLSCKLNTYNHMWIALFYSLKFTMFSLPSLLHIHKNYLHVGIQECDMMISPTSLIKHCKIRDYAGPPRVTFQGYHIMCICWVPPLLDPEVRQAYYFTVRGDERHDLPSLLTPMEIRYSMFTLRCPRGIHPYFSPCQEEVDALADLEGKVRHGYTYKSDMIPL